jgi:hypothetical protein
MQSVAFEWDEAGKAGINFRKHGVRLPEAIPVFDDRFAITVTDDESEPNERRLLPSAWRCGPPVDRRVHLARREHKNHGCAAGLNLTIRF